MHVLLDQGLPVDAATRLRAQGIDCTHVEEINMSQASDQEIIACGRLGDSVIVTLDGDFHMLLAVQRAVRPSVIRIRMQRLDGTAASTLIAQVLADYRTELRTGCLVTVKPRKTTCRMLREF